MRRPRSRTRLPVMFNVFVATLAALLLSSSLQARSVEPLLVVVDGAEAGAELVHTLARDHGAVIDDHWALTTLDAYCFEVRPTPDASADALLRGLRHDPRVRSVQGVQVHAVAGMPVKDPYYDLQMRTQRRGVAPVLRRGSGRNVRVAVIDTGVDTSHPDLAGQIDEAVNFVGGDANLVPAEFHGTGVIGLIAALPGNGVGIHGIAPETEMLALRACWEPAYGYGLCSTNTLAQALDYAIDVRARIINLSLAGPEDPLLARLVNRAIELGALVFGAVGEDAEQRFPASIPGVIAVEQGATGDLQPAAPRLQVPGQQLLTTVPDNRYDFVTGSSFATAHASGVAAVMLELEPHLRAEELVEWLQRLHPLPSTAP